MNNIKQSIFLYINHLQVQETDMIILPHVGHNTCGGADTIINKASNGTVCPGAQINKSTAYCLEQNSSNSFISSNGIEKKPCPDAGGALIGTSWVNRNDYNTDGNGNSDIKLRCNIII